MRALLFAFAVLASACSSPGKPFAVSLDTTANQPARVRVSGLSSAEASALNAAALSPAAWSQVLRVTTVTADSVPVAGAYAVAGTEIFFSPSFPFDPGRAYNVHFDPSKLPAARQDPVIEMTVALPAAANAPPVSVEAIYPSGDEWPANLLRFYVHFTGTMSRESGVGRVHLIDDRTGKEIGDALLPAEVDFWSPDQTRYTVFFEPGRVKRGIQPNMDEGRALIPGQSYTITVDANWRDASGRPLALPHKRTFRVGPPREMPLSMDSWRMNSPASGSREPLTIKVPWPLDNALFTRAIGVASAGQTIDGQIEIARNETEWRFTPAAAWTKAPHELVVLSALEDPSGNRIGRAFEVLPTDPAANRELPETFRRALTIR